MSSRPKLNGADECSHPDQRVRGASFPKFGRTFASALFGEGRFETALIIHCSLRHCKGSGKHAYNGNQKQKRFGPIERSSLRCILHVFHSCPSVTGDEMPNSSNTTTASSPKKWHCSLRFQESPLPGRRGPIASRPLTPLHDARAVST